MKRLIIVLTITMALLVLSSCFPGSGPKVPKSLLIDDIHSNYTEEFEPSKRYETLIKEFRGKGYTVDLASVKGFSPENYGAVLVATPGDAFSAGEIADLSALLSRGGKIIVLGEWFEYYDNTILNTLLSALGIDIQFNNNKILDESNNYDFVEYWVTTSLFESHRITSGLDEIALFGACSLSVGSNAETVSYAETTAYPEGEDSVASLTLIAAANSASGRVIAIGDTNVFANDTEDDFPGIDDYIDITDNLKLLRNIIEW